MIAAYVAGVLLIALASVEAHIHARFAGDLAATLALQRIQWPPFHAFMNFISLFGYFPGAEITVGLAIVLFAVLRRWVEMIGVMLTTVADGLVVLVKILVDQPRPPVSLVRVEIRFTDPSFPSGHVVHYVVFFGFLFFVTMVAARHAWWRIVALWGFGALILLVGVSRIYLGEHWLSDVLAGYLMGAVCLSILLQWYTWARRKWPVTRQVTAPTAMGEAS